METFILGAVLSLVAGAVAYLVNVVCDYRLKKKIARFMADVVNNNYEIGPLEVKNTTNLTDNIFLTITVIVSDKLSFKRTFTLSTKDTFMLREALPASNGLGYIGTFLRDDKLVQELYGRKSFGAFCNLKAAGKKEGLKLLQMYKKAYTEKSAKQPLTNYA